MNDGSKVGHVYGYVRVSTDRQAVSPESQREIIREAARRHGRGVDAWFQDAPVRNADGTFSDAASGKVALPERPAGRELCNRLKAGDVLIVAKVDRAFRKLSDCVLMLDRWERLGVSLILCDFPMFSDLSNPFGKAMIQLVAVFAEIERKLISQRTKEALALRKHKRQATNQYAGYGWCYEKRWDAELGRRVKVKVEDFEERRVMREIVRLREEGHSWDAIRQHLDYSLGVRTRAGKPWSQSRIVRAFHAELMLQASDNGG